MNQNRNAIPKYLYHLTDKSAVRNILANGLEPRIGVHSQIVEEEEELIYLSDYDSLPYWKMFFSNTALLRIDTDKIDKDDLSEFEYEHYSEWSYDKPIPTSAISITESHEKLSPEKLIEFKLGILDTTCPGHGTSYAPDACP